MLLKPALSRKFHATEAIIYKALRDAAVVLLPQGPDNVVNDCLSQHPKGENFLSKKRRFCMYRM